jgi:hypothetical protein
VSKDVKKKKSEETVQDEVKNQETDAKKKEACNCESECKADESQNTCEADESDKAEAQDESTESSKKKDPKDAVIEELQDRVKRQMLSLIISEREQRKRNLLCSRWEPQISLRSFYLLLITSTEDLRV